MFEKIVRIKSEFFTGGSKSLFKSLVTNKNLKVIVCFVYNTVSYLMVPEKSTDETAPTDACSNTVKDDLISNSDITHPTPRSINLSSP